ncbi:MAG: hypothetical protein ACXW2C_04845 [Acidimicrobiia bacterium]
MVVALCLGVALGAAAPAWAALPSEAPADTYQVNGRVRSVVVVGDRVWMGGVFSQVQSGNGANVQGVTNLAVLGRTTGGLVSANPLALGGASNAQVWKLAVSGNTVYAAGKFSISSGGSTYKNLLAFDGTTGALIASFKPKGISNATAVTVSGGTVYVGRKKLQAVDAGTGASRSGFATSTLSTDPSLRGHNTPPQHRELLVTGGWLYSACQCDSLTQGGSTGVKALVRFNPTTGAHDSGFTPAGAGVTATGIAVATDGTNLYLGAGGSDFLARYSPSGAQAWKRDTSGSAQAVRVSGGDLILGGHFVEIADAAGDGCGFKSSNPGTLDPNDECQTRNRLAAYSLSGGLLGWNPSVTGNYNGVWSIALDGTAIHIGGEFRQVRGIRQTYYARLN